MKRFLEAVRSVSRSEYDPGDVLAYDWMDE